MQLDLFFAYEQPQAALLEAPFLDEFDMNPYLADAKDFWDQPESLMRYRKVLHQDLLEAQANHEGDLVCELTTALREIKSRLTQISH